MDRGSLLAFLHQIRARVGTDALQDLGDAELLRRCTGRREEAAFALLVQRHGRLVWDVCRRVLRHDHDAEDAFQATFLALACHAASISAGSTVAGWLYRVAYRVALKLYRDRARRQTHESQVCQSSPVPLDADVAGRELDELVRQELCFLPEKYQAPFVLCCLEGKSKAEAARELGWKEGTVSGRLAEARKRIRQQLLRRGVTLSVAWAAGVLPPLPAALARTVVKVAGLLAEGRAAAAELISPAVAHLAKGVGQAMIPSKLKTVAALVLLGGVLAGGAGALTQRASVIPAVEDRVEDVPPAALTAAQDVSPLVAESPAPVQPPPPQPAADPLDAIVRRLHETMDKAETYSYQVVRTVHNKVFNSTYVHEGAVRAMKPDLFVLELRKKGEPEAFEKFVCDGKSIHMYFPSERTIRVHDLPRGGEKGPPAEAPGGKGWLLESPFTFFFGVTPAEARRRYDLELIKEDQWYIYVVVKPRNPADRQLFTLARVVLHQKTLLPRQLWYAQPNRSEVTFDFPKVETGVPLNRAEFTAPIPAGWRQEKAPSPDERKKDRLDARPRQ